MEEVTPEVLTAINFAQTIARDYERQGGDPAELISAYAGLVAERDPALAATCLGALEEGARRLRRE